MSNLYKGPTIDASYQVSVHLAEGFQRRRLKCEKLTDAKRWQKLTLPLARRAKNEGIFLYFLFFLHTYILNSLLWCSFFIYNKLIYMYYSCSTSINLLNYFSWKSIFQINNFFYLNVYNYIWYKWTLAINFKICVQLIK
jgi:hypothetical protein